MGLGVISWNRKISGNIIRRIKSKTKDKIVFCGGKDPSFVPEKYIDYGADAVVIGEGEDTVVELFNAYRFKSSLDKVKGIVYRNSDCIVRTEHREPRNLNNLLFPAFELVDYEYYTNIRLGGIPGHFIKTGFMMANRGCPFSCEFCSNVIRNVYRQRTIEDIIEEIKWQKKEYKIDGLVFLDDLFYFRDQWIIEFCQHILKENIKLKIYAQTRLDTTGKKETLELMKRAGFIQLAIGVESGSPRILDKVNKGLKVDQIKSGIKAINDAGIYTYSYLIIGLPYENEEDLNKTEELLKEINSTFIAVNYYMPMPGTELYSQEDDELLDKVSFSLTENQTFRSAESQKKLASYRAKFQSMSQKNPNLNLFKYPGFYAFLAKVLLLHPHVLLKGVYIQKKKRTYSNYFEAARTAMINFGIYG